MLEWILLFLVSQESFMRTKHLFVLIHVRNKGNIFTDCSKLVILLWIIFYYLCFVLMDCLVISLQPWCHLVGKGWPPGSLVCDVFLCLLSISQLVPHVRCGIFLRRTQLKMTYFVHILLKDKYFFNRKITELLVCKGLNEWVFLCVHLDKLNYFPSGVYCW